MAYLSGSMSVTLYVSVFYTDQLEASSSLCQIFQKKRFCGFGTPFAGAFRSAIPMPPDQFPAG